MMKKKKNEERKFVHVELNIYEPKSVFITTQKIRTIFGGARALTHTSVSFLGRFLLMRVRISLDVLS